MNKEYIDERIKKLVEEHNSIIDAESRLDRDRQEMESRRLQILGSINELKIMKSEIENKENSNKSKDNETK